MPTSAALESLVEIPVSETEFQVQVVTADAAFRELEATWNRVLETLDADRRYPFLEFCWARTWWECFGGGNQLYVLVLRLRDEPIAIAPMMLSRVRMSGVSVRRLGFLYNSHVPRADFLIGQHAEWAYRAIWRHLSENRCWDVLQLCQIPGTSCTSESIATLAERDGFATGTWDSGASPYVDTAGEWSAYFNALAAKHRSNLRNRLKRIGQLGDVELETLNSAPGLESALEDGYRIEASAWKGSEGTAIACSPELRRFYSEFARQAAERGWLRLNFLRAGGRRVAFDYSLTYGNRSFLLKLGYDQEFSAYAPSQLLLQMVLRGAFDRRLDRYDFLGEFVEWKRSWATQSTSHSWLFVTAPGIRGRFFHFAKFRLIPLAKRMLGRV